MSQGDRHAVLATVQPGTIDQLRAMVAAADAARDLLPPVDLGQLDRVLAFSPDDLTVTVEAGITVAALQQTLAATGQWLPLDPPHPATTSVSDLLQYDISGPRRYGHGTVREHVLGLTAITGDGRLVHSGGQVVKNVAGYDLARLFIGDRRTLGIVVEVTFKLMPRPAEERFVAVHADRLEAVGRRLDALIAGPTTPIVIDVHTLDAGHRWTLVVGYAGHPDDVAWQIARHESPWRPVDGLDHEARFWDGQPFASVNRTSVLPSRVIEAIAALGDRHGALVCRAGNGVIYRAAADPAPSQATAGPPASTHPPATRILSQRLAATFDPHGVLQREGRSA